MDKPQLIEELKKSYQLFIQTVEELSPDEFEYAPEGKWAAGQHAEHLLKSVKPVTKGMGYPKILIRQKFGKANRPSKTYDQLVERYREKTDGGGKTTKSYEPDTVTYARKEKVLQALNEAVDKLCAKIEKWDEEHLDAYVFPHPLLGKVTVREMIYFTSYHAEHHRRLIKLYLKGV